MNVPHAPEIERAVIGELLLEPGLLRKNGLWESDFYGGGCRRIFQAMRELFRKTQSFDLPLLADVLGHEDFELLNSVASEAFILDNFSIHTARLRELSAKRNLQKLCFDAAAKIENREIGETLMKVRTGLSEILTGEEVESVSAADLASSGWKRIEDRAKRRGQLSGIPCGMRPIDDHTDGLQPCELTLIAARPGQGKTAFALHALLSGAQAGFAGSFCSIEMSRSQISDRLHSSLSGVPLWKVRKGILGAEEWGKITGASTTINSLPIHFCFQARSLKEIISWAIYEVENNGAKILFLDYLQLIKAEGAQNREREIGMISGELKALAKSLHVPVVALSQLSRAPEKREDKRPTLADLRDSGALEQDADSVLMLYRDMSEPKGPIDFIVAKGRQSGTGTFTGYFDGELQKFSESSRRD